MEAKELRETTLEAPRRGAEVKDDDPIIPFGPQPTVSRFGAISRTSKTGYQTTGPVQAMASTSQSQNSKNMPMTGKRSHTHTFECSFKITQKHSGYNYSELLHIHLGQENPQNNGIIPSVLCKILSVKFCH